MSDAGATGGSPVYADMYRVREVAMLLDLHRMTVYRLIRRGDLRASRHGSGRGVLRISPIDLADYQQRSAERATAPCTVLPAQPEGGQ